jgi:hypothetical protein
MQVVAANGLGYLSDRVTETEPDGDRRQSS